MRIKWNKSFIGYEKNAVLRYVSQKQASFAERREKLATELEHLTKELAVVRERTAAAGLGDPSEKHLFLSLLHANRTGSRQESSAWEEGADSFSFRTVLFGLNKRSVKRAIRKMMKLQQEELQELGAQIADARFICEQMMKQLSVPDTFLIAGHSEPPLEESPPQVNEAVDETEDEGNADELHGEEQLASPNEPVVEMENTAARRQPVSGKLIVFPNREQLGTVQHPPVRLEQVNQAAPVKPKAVGSGFWEDAGDYLADALATMNAALLETGAVYEVAGSLTTAESYTASVPYHDDHNAGSNVFKAAQRSSNKPSGRPANPQPAVSIGESHLSGDELKTGQNEANPAEYDTPLPEGQDNASQAVSQEIRDLRSKYIVGKIAGEDLYDGNGRLIIGKLQPITYQAMLKAEQNGKLAELIVNMIIPGLGDA